MEHQYFSVSGYERKRSSASHHTFFAFIFPKTNTGFVIVIFQDQDHIKRLKIDLREKCITVFHLK